MKKYLIFAGISGAGKTTLYQANNEYQNLPRVNMDEIVRTFGSWKNSADVFRAGKIAVSLIKKYLDEGISFNQETTLCGHSILKNIERAKELGYDIELYYVGLASADLAKSRVEQRVRDGGHGISPADIEKRYTESLENLKEIIPKCDRVKLYDNTVSFRKIASFIQGELKDCAEDVPQWCSGLLRISGWSNAYSRLPFPVRLPAAEPVNAAELTEEELNMELEKGHEDMFTGKVKSAQQVFADIRKDYGR